MKQVIIAVRDSKADAFGRPFFVASAGVGIRSFDDEVNRRDPENQMNNHPSDFALYQLGEYDDSTGIIECYPQPKLLIQADQVLKV